MPHAVRWLALAIFLATAGLAPGAIFDLRYAAVGADPEVEVPLDVLGPLEAGLSALSKGREESGREQIAFLGDSMVMAYGKGRTVPERLQQRLDATTREGRFAVHSLAAPGMGPFDFYFVAERVARARPDQVILPINLTSFSAPWRHTFSRPQLAGLLPAGRVLEALGLPLDRIGLTADRLLLYFAIGRSGSLEEFHRFTREQALLGSARKTLAYAIGRRFGDDADERFAVGALRYFGKLWNIEGRQRLTAAGTLHRLGPVLRGVEPDDASLRVLEATIRIYRDRDVDVLVYANPTNVEHMEEVGVLDAPPGRGLEQTVESIRQVSSRAGAHFLDLHALLADDRFRDGAGHLRVKEGGPDGPAELAAGIAPAIRDRPPKRIRLR